MAAPLPFRAPGPIGRRAPPPALAAGLLRVAPVCPSSTLSLKPGWSKNSLGGSAGLPRHYCWCGCLFSDSWALLCLLHINCSSEGASDWPSFVVLMVECPILSISGLSQYRQAVAHIENQGQADKGSKGLTLPRGSIMTNMRSQRIKAPAHNQSGSSQVEVYLISLRNKCKVVAKGKLVTTDSTRNIGGTMLRKEFVGVYVDALENNGNGNNGDEMLPRPLYSMKTMRDAIGFIVAWPRSHVKRLKSSTQTCTTLHDGNM